MTIRNNRFSPVIIAILFAGTAISISLFYLALNWEWQEMETQFGRIMDGRVASLQRELDQNFATLINLRGLFNASENVMADEFRTFLAPTMARHGDLLMIGWAPRVESSQVQQFEGICCSGANLCWGGDKRRYGSPGILSGFACRTREKGREPWC